MSNIFEIKNNKLIWKPSKSIADKSRQFKVELENKTNNMKSPTVPVEYLSQLLEFFDYKEDLRLTPENPYALMGEFYIDIQKFWNHIEEMRKLVPVSIFHKDPYKFSKIDNFSEGKIRGSIYISLRAFERKELCFSFGKPSPIRTLNLKQIKEEEYFNKFLFGGFFGGEIKKEHISMVNLSINKLTREISHEIDSLEIDKALSLIYDYKNILVENNEKEQNEYENKLIEITRFSNLSVRHNKIRDELANILRNKGYEVFVEYYNQIDVLAKKNSKNFIFEVKSSISEIYKSIGQILCYETLMEDDCEKFIVVGEENDLSDYIKKTISKNKITITNLLELSKGDILGWGKK